MLRPTFTTPGSMKFGLSSRLVKPASPQHLGQPLLPDVSGLAKAMREQDGRLFWHWDPRTAEPQFLHPPSEAEALVAAARRVTTPVVLVRAELSEIVSKESVQRFKDLTSKPPLVSVICSRVTATTASLSACCSISPGTCRFEPRGSLRSGRDRRPGSRDLSPSRLRMGRRVGRLSLGPRQSACRH